MNLYFNLRISFLIHIFIAFMLMFDLSSCSYAGQVVTENSLAGIRLGRPVDTVLSKYGMPNRVRIAGQDLAETFEARFMRRVKEKYFQSTIGELEFELKALKQMEIEVENEMKFAADKTVYRYRYMAIQVLKILPMSALLYAEKGDGILQDQNVIKLMNVLRDKGDGEEQTIDQRRSKISRQIVTYYYEVRSGYLLSLDVGKQGLIERIDVHGIDNSNNITTRRGVKLGDDYGRVINVYGFPLSQELQSDGTLLMNYSERSGVSIYILGNRVVGISVALPD